MAGGKDICLIWQEKEEEEEEKEEEEEEEEEEAPGQSKPYSSQHIPKDLSLQINSLPKTRLSGATLRDQPWLPHQPQRLDGHREFCSHPTGHPDFRPESTRMETSGEECPLPMPTATCSVTVPAWVLRTSAIGPRPHSLCKSEEGLEAIAIITRPKHYHDDFN
ncbi:uncharacterized protein ACOB8E_019518 isoform 1-T1 [Sarcophilus harrisii]